MLGEFIQSWVTLERGLSERASENSLLGSKPRTILDAARFLEGAGLLSRAQIVEIDGLRRLRNEVLHGMADHRTTITPAVVSRVKELAALFGDEQPDT